MNRKYQSDRNIDLRKPELLAPAGSPSTWAAALEAGADAVYLGLKDFSARAFAANFTMGQLARVVDLTHERGAKIFLAFNAAAKEKELPQAARTLEALSHISPDALIVQDLGLMRLIRRHFPHFEVHASTLTAVHNQPGLEVLKKLGFDRAVLGRELTLNEVEKLTHRSPLGLEIFIHGALCFSFSGLCLMSSFLGGKGSIRGACTQPCRRRYTSGKKRGYFFSPTDLEAGPLMERIRQIPLAALKIEGRMKGAEYVYRVVKAYRLLLDAPADDMESALEEARRLIDASLGRHRSTGFLNHPRAVDGLVSMQAATSGQFLGKITKIEPGGGLVSLNHPLEVGDRLRVQFKSDDERKAFTLKELTVNRASVPSASGGTEVVVGSTFKLSPGDLLFKVDSKSGEFQSLASPLVKAIDSGTEVPNGEYEKSGRLKKALNEFRSSPVSNRSSKKPEIWYRLSKAEELPGMTGFKNVRVILPVSTPNVRRITAMRRRLGDLFSKIIWAMPPLVFNPAIRKDLEQLNRMGFREFMISNLGNLPLLDLPVKGKGRRPVIYGDHRLNCLNTWTERQLADLGLAAVTLSLENDEENFKSLLAGPGPVNRLLYLYGRPPLFTSRFMPGLKGSLPVISPRQERFRLHQEKDYCVVFSEKPVFFASFLKYKQLPGVTAFIIDLEHDPNALRSAKEVTDAVHRGRAIKNTSRFNYKRTLY